MNYLWITILAFTVLIPTIVGIVHYNRISIGYKPIVWLCILWSTAEVYAYLLRINGMNNAHISYLLTAVEIYLYANFYDRACSLIPSKTFKIVGIAGIVLTTLDFIIFRTAINTFSLTAEYILISAFVLYLFYENVAENRSREYYFMNLVILFYTISSFPYFFAWEWLRTDNIPLLILFGNVHAGIHAICYILITFLLWKSTSSLSEQSSFH